MKFDLLLSPDRTRIRWLCNASNSEKQAFCSNASIFDALPTHSARFSLHLAEGNAIPARYALDVFKHLSTARRQGATGSPVSHVLTLATFSLDLHRVKVPPELFIFEEDNVLWKSAIYKFSTSWEAFGIDQLEQLCRCSNPRGRLFAAWILVRRQEVDSERLISRLIDDEDHRVARIARYAAARMKVPELSTRVASEGDFFSLGLVGHPQGRERVQLLVQSENPLDGEEAVLAAHALGDADLLSDLWEHPIWETQKLGILTSAAKNLIADARLAEILRRLEFKKLCELACMWPESKQDQLNMFRDLLSEPVGPLHSARNLSSSESSLTDQVDHWLETDACLCGAALRFTPRRTAISMVQYLADSNNEEANAVGIQVMQARNLTECGQMLAELCISASERVAETASNAAVSMGTRLGVYGLDTAVLRMSKEDERARRGGVRARLSRLVESIKHR